MKKIKYIIIFLFIIIYLLIFFKIKCNEIIFKKFYNQLKYDYNLNFSKNQNIHKKIKIGIYSVSLSDGGLQRITAKLINLFDSLKIFEIYLFTQKEKEENEYKISDNINRVVIKNIYYSKYLIKKIKKKKIDIFIYQFPVNRDIKALNNFKKIKTIFYIHSSFFYWFYTKYFKILDIYKEYKNSQYIISIIPLENDYLFKKWGINSIYFDNFLTYDYDSIIPSNLSENKILLIGRGRNKLKRFNLGIQSIEYIKNSIANIKLMLVTKFFEIDELKNCIYNLNLQKNVLFVNYSSDPSIYYKDASLNFLTSISEANPLVLSETKIYGIPNIILGLDYVSLAKMGTIIIYDDTPERLAKESLKILNNKIYKKNLSKQARMSMRKFDNNKIANNWKKLLFCVINNIKNYQDYFVQNNNNTNELYNILKNQVFLLNNRNLKINITIEDLIHLPNISFSKKSN